MSVVGCVFLWYQDASTGHIIDRMESDAGRQLWLVVASVWLMPSGDVGN